MNVQDFVDSVAEFCDLDQDEAMGTSHVILAAIADYLSEEESKHLAAQLPEPFRSEVRKHHRGSQVDGNPQLFLKRISKELEVDGAEAAIRSRAVFAVLKNAITRGELRHLLLELPEGIQEILQPPRVTAEI